MEITEDALLKRGFIRDPKYSDRFYTSYYFYGTGNEAYTIYLLDKSNFKYWILQLSQDGLIRQESAIRSLETLDGFLDNLAHESNTYSEVSYQYLLNLGFYDSISIDKFEWKGDFGDSVDLMYKNYAYECKVSDFLGKTYMKNNIKTVQELSDFLKSCGIDYI